MHTWAPLQAHLPFAVVGSTEEVKVGNKLVRARQYPWGVVQGECRGESTSPAGDPNLVPRPALLPAAPVLCARCCLSCLYHSDHCPVPSPP